MQSIFRLKVKAGIILRTNRSGKWGTIFQVRYYSAALFTIGAHLIVRRYIHNKAIITVLFSMLTGVSKT